MLPNCHPKNPGSQRVRFACSILSRLWNPTISESWKFLKNLRSQITLSSCNLLNCWTIIYLLARNNIYIQESNLQHVPAPPVQQKLSLHPPATLNEIHPRNPFSLWINTPTKLFPSFHNIPPKAAPRGSSDVLGYSPPPLNDVIFICYHLSP